MSKEIAAGPEPTAEGVIAPVVVSVWDKLLPPEIRPNVQLIVIIALSVQLSWYLWSPNLKAMWGLADDHEILAFLGSDKQVGFFEIPRLFINTEEVRSFGKYGRFRPGYYFLRIFECFLWGANPSQWYAARIGMFAISLTITMWLAARVAGFWVGVAFAFWVAGGPYWADIWARLGPAETYASVGTALFCLGFVLVIDFTRRKAPNWCFTVAWLISGLGGLMSIGSKENFTVLAIPVAFLMWFQFRHKMLTFASSITGLLLIALSIAVALAVGVALSHLGKDIYEQSVGVGSRSTVVFNFLGHNSVVRTMAFLGVILAAMSYLPIPYPAERYSALRRLCLKIAVSGVLIFFLYISQLYYYNTLWAHNSRYAFPGDILRWLSLFLPVAWILNEKEAFSLTPVVHSRLTILITLFLLGSTWIRSGIQYSLNGSAENVRISAALTQGISRLDRRISTNKPDVLVVLWSASVGDAETFTTIRALLRAQGVANPIAIWTPDFAQHPTSCSWCSPALAERLKNHIKDKQENDRYGFSPLTLMKDPKGCIVVGITSMPPTSECSNAGILLP